MLCDESLLLLLNGWYEASFTKITLIREMIGRVCLLEGDGAKYVCKLYPSFYESRAVRAAELVSYLQSAGFSVPGILCSKQGKPYVMLHTEDGASGGVCVLFDYIEGEELADPLPYEEIGEQVGLLHRLLRRYRGELPSFGKAYFIDAYLGYLRKFGIDRRQYAWFQAYGNALWERVRDLPHGFYHGDMHEGNFLRAKSGALVLFDFDQSGLAFPAYDMAVLCNRTDYFRFDAGAYDRVTDAVRRFAAAYRKQSPLTEAEVASVYDFVAIHHYQCQAAVIEKFGLDDFNSAFFDAQYEWLAAWRALCEKKRADTRIL